MFNLTSITSKSTLKHSTLHSFGVEENELNARLTLLSVNKDIIVFKADAFQYQAVEDGKVCTFKYVGPDHIMINSTSDCARPLLAEEMKDSIIMNEGCRLCRAISTGKMYEPTNCKDITELVSSKPRIQIKHDGHRVRINCQRQEIVIGGEKKRCPNHIMTIEDDTVFIIEGLAYKFARSNITKIALNYDIPSRLNAQLGLHRSNFESLTEDDQRELDNMAKNTSYFRNLMKVLNEDELLPRWSSIHSTITHLGG